MNELHGGNIWKYPECCDFSANLNPLGMPESVRQAVIDGADLWAHYPDPECRTLREKLACKEHCPASQIVCGNGADDLLWRIVQAIRPKRALIAVPAFSEYRRALASVGCTVETFALAPENGFVLPESFLHALHPGLDMVILCHPNNPTGRLIPPALLQEISRVCAQNGTHLLLDACFLDLTAQPGKLPRNRHTIVLNAFTKTYAMPGLRLGYAVFDDAALAARVQDAGQFWSASVPAQMAGAAALEERAYLRKSRQMIAEERRFLTEALQALPVEVFPSDANFLLFRARSGLFRDMQKTHFLIRSCANFEELDETFYRIAVRPHGENERLTEAIRRCL